MGIRSIIFRGKRIDDGEWVEGFYLYTNENTQPVIIDMECCSNVIIPETIGQYTGLTDKNGRKIFEGDIVSERGGESCQGYYEIDNVLTVKIPDTLVNFEMSYDCEYKIIGNVYDNSELIGGAK